MRAARWFVIALLAGCPSQPGTTTGVAEPLVPPDPSPSSPNGSAAGQPDGAACLVSADCASGICEGPGCTEQPGTCAPRQRACTKDLREYCGCDGKTFQSSGSCPGSRYQSPGACPGGAP